MFKHLKLNYPPILIDVILDNLGKINIVCGKNNSGKSSLLESIKDEAKRAVGRRLNKEETDFIFESSVKGEQWPGASDDRAREVYKLFLEEVSRDQELWYQTEKHLFADKVVNRKNKNSYIKAWRLPVEKVIYAFEQLLGEHLKVILLPPKGNLALKSPIDTSQKPSPEGTGILNYLFFAANKYRGFKDRELFEKIGDAFGKITDGYSFHISADEGNQISLSFSYRSKSWIYAEGCGLGLQDLLVILVFAILPKYQVVLIEEPESHLHPDMQRKLLSFLKGETDKQYFISTHSNVFLNNAFIDRVFFTSFDERIHVRDETSKASILDDLGYSVAENLVSDLIILVEGPSDIPVIEEFLIKLGLYELYDIKMWPLGGDIMDQVDLSVFAEKYSITALIDRDPKSRRIRKKFEEKCTDLGIPILRLKRYAIENYFTLTALKSVFGSLLSEAITKIDPNEKLEKQLGFNPKKSNRLIAKAMSVEDIKDTDLMGFFDKVREMCESGN